MGRTGLSVFVLVLGVCLWAGAALAADAAVAVLDGSIFAVVRGDGKSVELYGVEGGRLRLLDAAYLLTDEHRTVDSSTYRIKHFEVAPPEEPKGGY